MAFSPDSTTRPASSPSARGSRRLPESSLNGNYLQGLLNQFLSLEWGQYREVPANKQLLLADVDMAHTAQNLRARYDLSEPWKNAESNRLLETLTYLTWLDHFCSLDAALFERVFNLYQSSVVTSTPELFDVSVALTTDAIRTSFRWLDVGAKNWSYVAALGAFLQKYKGYDYRLDGVELDTRRRYLNLKTRGQAAQTYSRYWPQANFHRGDILDWNEPAHIISAFLPFVFRDPHMAWGLAEASFQPLAFLTHLIDLLPVGGLLLVVNQGEDEAGEQDFLFEQVAQTCPISWQSAGQLPSPFIEYRYPRLGWICQRLAD